MNETSARDVLDNLRFRMPVDFSCLHNSVAYTHGCPDGDDHCRYGQT